MYFCPIECDQSIGEEVLGKNIERDKTFHCLLICTNRYIINYGAMQYNFVSTTPLFVPLLYIRESHKNVGGEYFQSIREILF
jgi:hypothetical protein